MIKSLYIVNPFKFLIILLHSLLKIKKLEIIKLIILVLLYNFYLHFAKNKFI